MRRQKPTGRKVIVEGKLLLEELSDEGSGQRSEGGCVPGNTDELTRGEREREPKDESITRATVAPKPNRTLCHV